jgi:hypothetical protein
MACISRDLPLKHSDRRCVLPLLVLKSPVQSGLLSIFGKTETETGLKISQNLKRLDWTALDQSFQVFTSFRPVLVLTSLDWSKTGFCVIYL